jgi:short-subunit dehydrogenase
MVRKTAMIIGNSDGIGLAVTRRLLDGGWTIVGISRSASTIQSNARYRHHVAEVQRPEYATSVEATLKENEELDLCIYCAGIGEVLDTERLTTEELVFEVNLMGLIRTVAIVVPHMIRRRQGHIIGLSSVADQLVSGDAPSYHASKAGVSSYLEGLALAMKSHGISVTNVRFGFVDTKMAKGDVKPLMMSADRAAAHVLHCIERRPIRYTAPKAVIPLVSLRKWMMRLRG